MNDGSALKLSENINGEVDYYMRSENKMNLVIYDWPVNDDVSFTKGLNDGTGEQWHSLGMKKINNSLIKTIANFFVVLHGVLHRGKYKKIICWNQIHGLLMASMLKVFKLKKKNDLILMCIIYKKKGGFSGKVWYHFFKYALDNPYVDKIICFSNEECDYYSKLFNIDRNKLYGTTFGIDDLAAGYFSDTSLTNENNELLLAAGRSNRDHKWLVDALNGTTYHANIIDRTYKGQSTDNCTILHNVTYGKELFDYFYNCKIVVVPLDDKNISAGQTVFIQAMMFGKPVIVTSSETLDAYIQDGINGFIIEKDREALLTAVKKLMENGDLYQEMSYKSRGLYESKFTVEEMGRNISKIIS